MAWRYRCQLDVKAVRAPLAARRDVVLRGGSYGGAGWGAGAGSVFSVEAFFVVAHETAHGNTSLKT